MKKAVSKILVLLAAVIAFSLLCGCKASEHISPSDKDFSNSDKVGLSAKKIGDSFYLEVKGDPKAYDCLMMAPQSWMELASIDQLYTSLKKQSFTDEQTYILAHGFDKDENGIKLPDPDRLYNFRLPENFEAVFPYTDRRFVFAANCYYSSFLQRSSSISVKLMSEEYFNYKFKNIFVDMYENDQYVSVNKKYEDVLDGYPAIFREYTTSVIRGKDIKLHIKEGNHIYGLHSQKL